jgi:uncharacterized phage protein (TIGR01671 family)
MNREIKFRAWDKRFNTMSFGSGDLLLRINEKDFSEPMQYTGLKDKNGKEIYEGDICKGIMPDSEKDEEFSNSIVMFNEDSFSLFNKTKDGDLYFGSLISPVINKCIEVIGNIFENPELIKN